MTGQNLKVTLYGENWGSLSEDSQGRVIFTSSESALEKYGVGSSRLSAALTLSATSASPQATESFFAGLLPEGFRRDALIRAANCAPDDLLSQLVFVGGDVAGGVLIPGPEIMAPGLELSEAEVIAELENPASYVGGGGSAVAGIQHKIAISRIAGTWHRASDGHPSTHILKPVSAENIRSADTEAYLMQLAKIIGLTNFNVQVEHFGVIPTVVIERYDRVIRGRDIHRIHQEDAAQALGLPAGGDEKFEVVNHRASLKSIAALLDRDRTLFSSSEPDRHQLLRYLVFNVLAGNTDAHAKNYSILHPSAGGMALAPIYDVTSPMLEYGGSHNMAMSVNGVRFQPDITLAAMSEEAASWGIRRDTAEHIIVDITQRTMVAALKCAAPTTIEATVPGMVVTHARNLLTGGKVGILGSGPLALMTRIP